MTTPPTTPDIPLPDGAVKASKWQDVHTDKAFRFFEGASWEVFRRNERKDEIVVRVIGIQQMDGRVLREVSVHQTHADDPLTPAEAMQLARSLISAVQEIERWSE